MQFVRRHASIVLPLAAVLVAGYLLLGMPISTAAQGPAPAPVQVASETLTLDHVQLNVPDPAAAMAWYTKYLNAKPGPAGEPNTIMFGTVRFIFNKADGAAPSQGSALDFIGFSVPDAAGLVMQMQADGVKVDSPIRDVPGMFPLGFVEDPWGTRVEIVQDPELMGLHHIHVSVTDPEPAFAWFLQNFGGTRGKMKGRLDAMQYSGVWMVIQKANMPGAPSFGRVIDNYGFRTTTPINAKEAQLKASGVTFASEPAKMGAMTDAKINGPGGAGLEIVSR